jgi:fatty-acyl-CoA synthase
VRIHVLPEYTPLGMIEAIESGATLAFLVPAAIQMMIQHPRAAEADFSSLRFLMYGAAPMPLELLKEAVRMMPDTGFMQVYGMTETTGTISLLPPEDHDVNGNQRMRSAGKAVPGVAIEVRGPDNAEVPRGEIGEVCILSPSNTAGYWNLPEATAKTIDPDGWLHTGDAGIMDEDGYVYIQDRIKDMIISGGENIYPAEVESAIYGHPAIAEVAIIGEPDPKWGESVTCIAALKPEQSLELEELRAWATERLARYKLPSRLEIIDAMRAMGEEIARGKLKPSAITEKTLRRHLYVPDMPDVDLFVRSSGEQRTSNFLLWEAAYAEMVFLDTLWPDFSRTDLWGAIEL